MHQKREQEHSDQATNFPIAATLPGPLVLVVTGRSSEAKAFIAPAP
ncbi:MAG: hypothetical protein ABSC05_29775 [Candidatus Solibacter sp.]